MGKVNWHIVLACIYLVVGSVNLASDNWAIGLSCWLVSYLNVLLYATSTRQE